MQRHARIKHFTVRTRHGDMFICDRHCTGEASSTRIKTDVLEHIKEDEEP